MQICVIARPALRALRLPVTFEPTHDIAIRVQHTYIWNGFGAAQPLLPAGLAKQRLGIEYGRSFRGFVVENWRGAHVSVQKEGREGMSSINRHAWQNVYTTKARRKSVGSNRPAMSLGTASERPTITPELVPGFFPAARSASVKTSG